MKNHFIYSSTIILTILFVGCNNWIEGYDYDPNSSPEVSIDNLFTASLRPVFIEDNITTFSPYRKKLHH